VFELGVIPHGGTQKKGKVDIKGKKLWAPIGRLLKDGRVVRSSSTRVPKNEGEISRKGREKGYCVKRGVYAVD